MQALRVVHASDLHLHVSHVAESIATVRALVQFTDSVVADLLLIAGDVFDAPNQPVELVDGVAKELAALRVPLVAVPGNHDIRYSANDGFAFAELAARWAGAGSFITADDGETVSLFDGALSVWGRGMPEHTPSNDPLDGVRACGSRWSIALAHGELGAGGGYRSSPVLLERHAAPLNAIDYVDLGHRHLHEVHEIDGLTVAYSGSSSQVIGRGDVALVDLEYGGAVRVKSKRLEPLARVQP